VIAKHRHDQPPHHPAATRNQIQVPVGDRVKRSRVDSEGWMAKLILSHSVTGPRPP